ncbi:hypothetical protein LEP48_07395 [Isoptericola sp. NEAU-Y5]|uniref:Uncharacterized protein n=1 Tax=Isoptericola luteus TaxID=2879484 RepID=A0ABS7ZFV0_9MICO|nr:hypothetical protein [Isoptericola sp. NEAU-Y5]MCA5893181.1 hypothetical protein [Isoptericola sp. NEAU-Y5]
MPVVAIAVPATPLLVPGVAGGSGVLSVLRTRVDEALAELVADLPDGGTVVVLAPASGHRSGVMRPSFASAGVGDRWVPLVRAWPSAAAGRPPVPAAEVPASVALCALAQALRACGRGAQVADVVVHELGPDTAADPGAQGGGAPDDVVAAVRAAAGVVVASGGLPGRPDPGPAAWAPAVRAVLDRVAVDGGWRAEVREAAGAPGAEHLADVYRVTVYRAPARDGSPAHEGPDAGQEAPGA